MPIQTDSGIKQILETSKTIAVVGCSRSPEKAANQIPAFMKEHGYRIIPVNPSADEILGEKSYKTISDVKEQVDIVDIFRPSEDVLDVVKEAIKIKPKVIWMQLGIVNEEAAKLAEENNIRVVMDRCLKIEYNRLM